MKKNLTNKQYNIRYCLIHAFYWMSMCAAIGFASVMMLDAGYTNTEIGVTFAVSSILSFILQPLVADLADKNKSISLQKLLIVFIAAIILCLVGIFLYPYKSLLYTVLILVVQALIVVLQPLINSLSTLYAADGIYLNYGAARGCGSFTYSVCSFSMGALILVNGVGILPISAIIILIAMIASVASFRSPVSTAAAINKAAESESKVDAASSGKASGLWEFARRNRWFTLFACAAVIMLVDYTLICTYSIQIVTDIGGNEASMGIAVALTAIFELPAMLLFDKLKRRFGSRALLRVSALFYALKYILVFSVTSVTGYYIIQVTQVLGYALYIPASVSFAGEALDRSDAVKGQAFLTAAYTLSSIISCLLGGRLLDVSGVHTTLLVGMIVSVAGSALTFYAIGKIPLRGALPHDGAEVK